MRIPSFLQWVALGLNTAATTPALLFFGALKSPKRKHDVVQWWSNKVLRNAGVTFDVHGLSNVPEHSSYIIASNHRSHFDGPTLTLALPHPFYFIIKRELDRIPVWGHSARAAGFIAVDRGQSDKARAAMAKAVARIRGGDRVMVFVEGTRSTEEGLLPFKKGAFHLAIDAQVPILPVGIRGSREIMPKHELNPKRGHIDVHIGEPIPTEGLGKDALPELMARTRAVIEGLVLGSG